MSEEDVINRIRTIFLHQRPHVTLAAAAVLLGWSRSEMSRAVADGEVEVSFTSTGKRIARAELMAKAMEIWSPEVIEGALGDDAARVLPDAIGLDDLHVRMPRHHIAALQQAADREQTTISAVLARELDGIASAHADEFSSTVSGLAVALAWPDSLKRFPAEGRKRRRRG